MHTKIKNSYGSASTQCTGCHYNATIEYFLLESSHECLETCPVGYYQNTNTHICSLCSGCYSCNSGSTCTSCVDGTFFKSSTSTCVASDECGDPYYADVTTNACLVTYFFLLFTF